MKPETKQKIKEVYEKRKLEIIVGSVVIGGIIVACILKTKKEHIQEIEVLPEWAKIWQEKCNDENLLYTNGLPIFADDECTIVYKDVLSREYSVKDAEEDGFIVIERA